MRVARSKPVDEPGGMELRPSSGRNDLSRTCTIRATRRAQPDALYRALTAQPMVSAVLQALGSRMAKV